MHMIDID